MRNPVHIVCLDAPSPPDYGGAIDMYYKIKALAQAGAIITLHYFDYKKNRTAEGLKEYCKEVFAYHRKPMLRSLSFSKPHIVSSRINNVLIERLNADNYPILLEGIHCTGILSYIKKENRNIIVRLHNDEEAYYRHLAKASTNFFKSSYYQIESLLLKMYQKKLSADVLYATISRNDVTALKNDYGLNNVFLVPAFIPWQDVTCRPGRGTYCLYHGNLSVSENEAAAMWLIRNVFSKLQVPLIIAGKNPSGNLLKAAAPLQHIQIKQNPTEVELTDLIQNAHIHVLPEFNNTGIKLKLLHALFKGRFCVTHSREVENGPTIAIAQTPQKYMEFIESYRNNSFSETDITERKKLLCLYNNNTNAQRLSECL